MVYSMVNVAARPRCAGSEHSESASFVTGLLTKGSNPNYDESSTGCQSQGFRCTLVHLAFTCSALGLAGSSAAAATLWWAHLAVSTATCRTAKVSQEPCAVSSHNLTAQASLGEAKVQPHQGGAHDHGDRTCFEEMLHEAAFFGHPEDPYQFTTGSVAHKLPMMYGHIGEKSIWAFWYDSEHCPFSTRCHMPAYIQLCLTTIRKHAGGFTLRLLHADTVDQYVSMTELPLRWSSLEFAQRRDTLMNALLARYGGVALDVSTVLFRPLDDYWDEMIKSGATFRGYMYRLNGRSWALPEACGPWFLMSRREGIFSTAVRDQRAAVCDSQRTKGLSLGDRTLTPILSMFNYSLPKCYEDGAVPVEDRVGCPEFAQPSWPAGITGPPRNDRRLLLHDPRDGPQLPFSRADEFGLAFWRVSNGTRFHKHEWSSSQVKLDMWQDDFNQCQSMMECWEQVFLPRFHAAAPFLWIFNPLGSLCRMSLPHLLADRDTFLYRWLSLAGVSHAELVAPPATVGL